MWNTVHARVKNKVAEDNKRYKKYVSHELSVCRTGLKLLGASSCACFRVLYWPNKTGIGWGALTKAKKCPVSKKSGIATWRARNTGMMCVCVCVRVCNSFWIFITSGLPWRRSRARRKDGISFEKVKNGRALIHRRNWNDSRIKSVRETSEKPF